MPLGYDNEEQRMLADVNFHVNKEYSYDGSKAGPGKNKLDDWNADPKDGGACGDFAKAKYAALEKAGFDMNRVHPITGILAGTGEKHAILLVDGDKAMDVKDDHVYKFNPDKWAMIVDGKDGHTLLKKPGYDFQLPPDSKTPQQFAGAPSKQG